MAKNSYDNYDAYGADDCRKDRGSNSAKDNSKKSGSQGTGKDKDKDKDNGSKNCR